MIEEQLRDTQSKLVNLRTKNDQLEERIAENDKCLTNDDLNPISEKLKATEEELEKLKNPPFIHECASSVDDEQAGASKTITYTGSIYSSTNTIGGGLELATGIFTSPYPGSYLVTWSFTASDAAGQHYVWIYLRKNKEIIKESRHWSIYTGLNGVVGDQGKSQLYLIRNIIKI